MKKYLILITLTFSGNLFAQNDTLYFDSNWNKTSKANAKFFRPVLLPKADSLFHIKDYYINGNLQMDGFWSDAEKEILHGKSTWYHENEQISEEREYDHGELNGQSTYYTEDGFLLAKGVFKNGREWSGTFYEQCCISAGVREYEDGVRIAVYDYYKGTNQIAQKTNYDKEDYPNITSVFYYDRKGNEIGNTQYDEYHPVNGRRYFFFKDQFGEIVRIDSYTDYKDGQLNGNEITYDEKGNVWTKGINKNGAPFSGTFFRNNELKTYVEGELEGDEIHFTENGKQIAKGTNKNGKNWEGQFVEHYPFQILNYKEGQPDGKQTTYFSEDFRTIKNTYVTSNNMRQGEAISYDTNGKQLSKGVYKDDKPWNGTFFHHEFHRLESYQNGKLHGDVIQYDYYGKIVSQQQFEEGEISGNIKSSGYANEKECQCIYKKGEPFEGQVCDGSIVNTYKNGSLVLNEYYDGVTLEKILEFENEVAVKQTTYMEGTTYELIYKNGLPFNGVDYNTYYNDLTTYKDGQKNGRFVKNDMYLNLIVEGNNKNNKWDGKITFTNYVDNIITTCEYSNGNPINGTILFSNKMTTYVDGKKEGKESYKFEYEIFQDGIYQIVYDSIARNYVKDSLDGPITYYKEGQSIASGVYKNNEPFEGVFYEDKRYENTYEKGDLVASIYRNQDIVSKTSYKNEEEIMTIEGQIVSKGIFREKLPYNGEFVTLNDKSYPTEYTVKRYKSGKLDGKTQTIEIGTDAILYEKEYKSGEPVVETWPFEFKGKMHLVGQYQNREPFSGYFYKEDDIIGILNHYKKGEKNDYQYFAVAGSKMQNLLDSISYKNGKPISGGELEMYQGQAHQHMYENGRLLKTNIHEFGVSNKPHAVIIYTPNGFITTKGKSGQKKYNEVIFSNSDKTSGTVKLFNDKVEIGYLEFEDGKLKNADIYFVKSFLGFKVYIEKPNVVVVEIKNDGEFIKYYPMISIPNQPDYKYFFNMDNYLLENDGTVHFYLDETKEPLSKLIIKGGKEYDGISFRYEKDSGTYTLKRFKVGTLFEEKKGLSIIELKELLDK